MPKAQIVTTETETMEMAAPIPRAIAMPARDTPRTGAAPPLGQPAALPGRPPTAVRRTATAMPAAPAPPMGQPAALPGRPPTAGPHTVTAIALDLWAPVRQPRPTPRTGPRWRAIRVV